MLSGVEFGGGLNKITVLSVYSFLDIPEPEILIYKTLFSGNKNMVKGSILIAKEGFNGYIAGKDASVYAVLRDLVKNCNLDIKEVNIKVNYCDLNPFTKFKVKLKKEIISMKLDYELDIKKWRGEYLDSHQWSKLIQEPDTVVIDTRNDYEVKMGTFKGAIDPKIKTFRFLPQWLDENADLLKDKKIAMFCTGGVRCEKSTAYLKEKGYNEVYHLEGGILRWFEDTANEEQLWEGECFVFDERVGVKPDLTPLHC
ncbi:oxygen-dependent tRNA uridine(34) hydroxylase TrhO [Candidatus Sarmatiella mevalonica]|uniref:oxygen-dependent tRNA uridine(34) hydroxylase TrhO n=1 Tax=Candidatus Sarmatiella mevalonica TaxID=2770581 RepID=UPI003977BA3B